ncbi:efflux RND transporter periplasmic adaptor subunit [Nemorincola caseinilytica]|uniref:Efflux RND transporter periplasmic adaptor subunit n=1 Tax=Nemorincola caseinilytica TaxID=2054315 RepID=A0ABP8N747_9BACT
MRSKKALWIIIIGVLLLVVLVIVIKNRGDDGTKVAVEKVARHTITETVTASGKIYPETEVKIAPEVSGEITMLDVQEGDSVHKGDVLVRINAAIYSSLVNQASASVSQSKAGAQNSSEMIAQAKSQYDLALATHNRNQKLYEQKVISQLEYEQGEANFNSAKASLEAAKASASGGKYSVDAAMAGLSQAKENLQRTTIVAPTSGIISQLNVKKGERVVGTAQMAGTEMLTIADMSRIEVRVDVSETDISKVKIGDTTIIEADAYRNRKFKGTVSKIAVSSSKSIMSGAGGNSSDQVTNYTVHITILPSSYADIAAKLPKGKFPFKPGMSASVEIQTNRQENILSVPVNAVTTRDWPDSMKKKEELAYITNEIRQVVFVYNDKTKTVHLRDVKTGLQDNKYLEITEGITENEQVVTAPYGAIARTLNDKGKVNVVDKEKLFENKDKDKE